MNHGEFLNTWDWNYVLEQTDGYDYDTDLSKDIAGYDYYDLFI